MRKAIMFRTGLQGGRALKPAGFRAALLRPVPTRLVVPALVESAIAALPLPWTVRVLDVVHRAPARLTRRSAGLAGPQRLDSLVLGEALVLTRPGLEDLAATLAHPEDALLPRTLLDVGHGPAGGLGCRGPACAAQALPRSGNPETDPRAWRDSGYRLLLSGGTAVAVAAT